ncbi:MAG: hypothetical protein KME08_15530 [Aphanothece sp. CMT-3BRIN-NPC111]|nr:hypothetical protein [Aphanothece sp. CMT-3BRIN-NPC111]
MRAVSLLASLPSSFGYSAGADGGECQVAIASLTQQLQTPRHQLPDSPENTNLTFLADL